MMTRSRDARGHIVEYLDAHNVYSTITKVGYHQAVCKLGLVGITLVFHDVFDVCENFYETTVGVPGGNYSDRSGVQCNKKSTQGS